MDSEIIRRYWAGEPRFLLKEDFGDRVDDVLREAGGNLPREITREKYESAKRLIEAGTPVGVMHREHNVRQDVIHRHFAWYRGARVGISADLMAKMSELADSGAPISAIASAGGVGRMKAASLFPKSKWTAEMSGKLGGMVSQLERMANQL